MCSVYKTVRVVMSNVRAVAVRDNGKGTGCMFANRDSEDNSVSFMPEPAPIGSRRLIIP